MKKTVLLFLALSFIQPATAHLFSFLNPFAFFAVTKKAPSMSEIIKEIAIKAQLKRYQLMHYELENLTKLYRHHQKDFKQLPFHCITWNMERAARPSWFKDENALIDDHWRIEAAFRQLQKRLNPSNQSYSINDIEKYNREVFIPAREKLAEITL